LSVNQKLEEIELAQQRAEDARLRRQGQENP